MTAGEAKNPEEVPVGDQERRGADRGVCIGALVVTLLLVAWTEFHAGASPFVLVFQRNGIPAAAGIMNFVVLTAALSSCNSRLYSAGRMLRTPAPGTGGVPPAQRPACSRGGHHRVVRDARHRRGVQRRGLAVNVIEC